jgi:hypothetical protein
MYNISTIAISFSPQGRAYPLLSGLCDVLVGFEEAADVHGLAAPDVAVDCPVKGEFEGTAVERAARVQVSEACRVLRIAHWVDSCSQDLGFGRHGWGCTGRRGLPMGLEGRLYEMSVLSLVYLDGRVSLQYCDAVPRASLVVWCRRLTEVQSASGNMPSM